MPSPFTSPAALTAKPELSLAATPVRRKPVLPSRLLRLIEAANEPGSAALAPSKRPCPTCECANETVPVPALNVPFRATSAAVIDTAPSGAPVVLTALPALFEVNVPEPLSSRSASTVNVPPPVVTSAFAPLSVTPLVAIRTT